jgi:quinol monooxygenase YgiN
LAGLTVQVIFLLVFSKTIGKNMVTLIAKVVAKDDKVAAAKAGLQELVRHTSQEPGCLSYTLHQDQKDPRVFFFYEQFQDQAAFDFHAVQPYIAALNARASELFEQSPQLYFVDVV